MAKFHVGDKVKYRTLDQQTLRGRVMQVIQDHIRVKLNGTGTIFITPSKNWRPY